LNYLSKAFISIAARMPDLNALAPQLKGDMLFLDREFKPQVNEGRECSFECTSPQLKGDMLFEREFKPFLNAFE